MSTTSISKSLLTRVLSVYFLLTLLVTAVQIMGEYSDTKKMLLQELQNQQSTFNYPLAQSLWEYNSPQIEAIADGLINIPAIAGLIIRDDKGRVIVQLGQTSSVSLIPLQPDEGYLLPEQNSVFGYFSTLVFEFAGNSVQVGDVSLFSTRDITIARIKVSLYYIIGSALIKSAFLILLFSIAFQRMLNRPMHDLVSQIKNFRLDDIDSSKLHLRDHRKTEFVMVENAYNQLLESLHDYQDDLKRTQQQLILANNKLDEQNSILEQEVARKTSNLSRVLVDLERRKNELEVRQVSLEKEIRQRQSIENDLRETNARLMKSINALELAHDQLIESDKMATLGGLVAGITHDVNTPIGISVTAATLIRDRLMDTEKALEDKSLTQAQLKAFLDTSKETLELLEGNLARASELISSFKQVAVDQTSEALRDINLYDYVHGVVQSLKPKLRKLKHTIAIDCPSDLNVRCPAGTVAQIFTNLIMNSLIHGFEQMHHGHIQITIKRVQNELHIHFADNGKGLTEEQLQQLFAPFYTTKEQQGGSGLGTHIVRNLITQTLGGHVEASSQPDAGLSYFIRFPVTFLD